MSLHNLRPPKGAKREGFRVGRGHGSGNGKTAIATSLARMLAGGVFVPHAVEIEGQIVRIYDPGVHQRLDSVRRYQMTHPEAATEAMNRLAQAFVCLTEAASKRAYDAELLGKAFDPHETEQAVDVGWDRAEAVAHLVADFLETLVVAA